MAVSQNSLPSIGSIPIVDAPPCHCSQPTDLVISWSDDNPGRRYYKCEDHGFVVWHDKERACRWQKKSLLEARDRIQSFKCCSPSSQCPDCCIRGGSVLGFDQ
ncbi:Uncharacterized protein Rs2_31503 [Raphanus sativus]|nr:Uncharacterized protein Rs2_31503 [Raphanus sativus]